MKKLFLLIALVGINVFAYSQDVKVNINNQDATTKDDCPYRINGICATEDIGGVDVETKAEKKEPHYYDYTSYIILTNYNPFPVNVLWKVDYRDKDDNGLNKIGNAVIGTEGQKKIEIASGIYNISITGLIVRKLAQ